MTDRTYPTRQQAIIAARKELEPRGGTIHVHKVGCPSGRDEPCECDPSLLTVRKAPRR